MEIDPQRVLVICQGSSKEPFLEESEFLFKSLIRYGGTLAESKKIACFSEPVSADNIQRFSDLGVKIRIVQDIDKKYPIANKIQNLSIYEEEDFDFLVSLDTDIIIARDFSSFLDESKVGVKPADQDPLSLEMWKQLFGHFGFDVPKERYLTSFYMKETIPYFNSGVLLIPKKYVSKLYYTWKLYVQKLLNSYNVLQEIGKHYFHTDQFALSLALEDAKIPHNALPLEMNFPTHYVVHEKTNPENLTPYLIHHHHRFSDGKMLHCSYPNINRLIDEINQSFIT